jgi:fused signal recognition particle receptor
VFKRLREGLFKRDDQPDVEQAGAAVEQEAPEEEFVEEPPSPAPSYGAPAHQAPSALSEVDVAVEAQPVDETPDERRTPPRNLFRFSLGRTRQLFGRVNDILEADEITDEVWDELEDTLISGDVGVTTTERLLATLRERVEGEHLERGSELRAALKEELALLLGEPEPLIVSETSPISVYLVVGVNGVGKTTSIAKLANLLKRDKHRVMLAAGDTFRAAAAEQIKTWGERIGTPVISHQYGADPGAVVFDAMQAAQARGADVLIVDTAGRLHTKFNLMEELRKIYRVLAKQDPTSPDATLLVIDATTGQNALTQAKEFKKAANVTGLILTKIDGTAKGGCVFPIVRELKVPIVYLGMGEQIDDLEPFDARSFVEALFTEKVPR